MKNKAQIQQVFTFIFIAIVIVAILFVGIKSINGLMNKGCEVQEKKLMNAIEEILVTYDTYGTKQDITLPGACDATAICFFNNEADRLTLSSDMISGSELAQIKNTVEGNIFLIQDGTIKQLANSPKVNATNLNGGDRLFCVKNKGGIFNLRVEGQGKTILFSEAS